MKKNIFTNLQAQDVPISDGLLDSLEGMVTESTLREYVKQIIMEVPLADIESYGGGGPRTSYSSIAYGAKPDYIEAAKKWFTDTKDTWYIITVEDIEEFENVYRDYDEFDEDFQDWVASKGWPKDAKYMVVLEPPGPEDFQGVDWEVVHDIIGHGMVGAVGPDISRQILDAGIPDFVPEDFDIAKSGTDRSPDVLAAIFANRFGPEDFNEDNDPTGERREVMQKAKEKIDAWKARFPKGKPEMINVEFVY